MPIIKREIRAEIPNTAVRCSRCYSWTAIYQLVLHIKGKKYKSVRTLPRCHFCAINAAHHYGLRMP